MVVLIAWIVAVVVALFVLGVVGYGLWGSIRRFQRAVDTARRDLEPRLARLRPSGDAGRHSA